MKKLAENIKLGIYQSLALLFSLFTLAFTFLPAYFEDGQDDLSIFQMMVGGERVGQSPLLIFAFLLVLISLVTTAILLTLLFLNRSKPLVTTILAILAIVTMLAGAAILTCSIFILGLDKLHSELGLVQGSWGFKIGNFLVPIFALISIAFSYPSAMIILHQQDKRDGLVKES